MNPSRCRLRSSCVAAVLVAAILVLSPANVAHATKFWKNGVVAGNWNVSNNWSAVSAAGGDNGGVPVAGEAVNIVHTNGTARTVTYDVNAPSLGLLSIDLTGAGATTNTLSIPNNDSLSASGIYVGGYSGSGATAGRGAVIQTAGTVAIASLDFVLGHGAGSTGAYTLGGTGALTAAQSEFIGFNGTATFNHSAGTNTIGAGAVGGFDVGTFAGANGTYNLSGSGVLVSNKSEFIGGTGTGLFNQTGGSNTINGAANHLYLGNNSGGIGTYTISGTATLTAGGNVFVGNSGVGTLTIQNQASVSINNSLSINGTSTVNLNGGTLRFNGYTRAVGGIFNYTSGTVRLAGGRILGFDAAISDVFGVSPTIATGKGLTIEGGADIQTNVAVTGGQLQVLSPFFRVGNGGDAVLSITNGGNVSAASDMFVGSNLSSFDSGSITVDGIGSSLSSTGAITIGLNGTGDLQVTNGGSVTTTSGTIGGGADGTATLSGAGSKWMVAHNLTVGSSTSGTVNVQTGALLHVANQLSIGFSGSVNLNGGTVRFDSLGIGDTAQLFLNSGTIQLSGNRTIGTDTYTNYYFGSLAVLPTGKGLTVEGTATIATSLTLDGGTLSVGSLINNGTFTFNSGVAGYPACDSP